MSYNKLETSPWQKYREKNGTTPLDALNPNTKKTSNEIANKRYNICLSCPQLIKLTKQCKKCGCFMTYKVKLESSKCPINNW